MRLGLTIGAATAVAVLCGCAPAPQAGIQAGNCAALTRQVLPQARISSATQVEATAELPAYCEVQATISPEPGSSIGVVYRLPVAWNGKALALGGGGWMGNVTLQAATEGLQKGYATLQTDAGHSSGTIFDASPWALRADGSANEPALVDFSHRAIHLMTVRGKQLLAAHYGKPPARAYYQGCSTGGRMGMMATQRHPRDFDGVIAGAPVYTLQTQTSAQLRAVAFAAPGARLLPAHLSLVEKAVLAACDGADGAADGVLRDPRTCEFDPGVLQCRGGQGGESCLTAPQVTALRTVYAGQRTTDGSTAAYPLEKGGETGWARFVAVTGNADPGTTSGGMHALRGPLLGDPQFDLSTFTPQDVATVRSSWLAREYEAHSADLSAFRARGGKLLLYHGFNDPGPSARGTVEYYEAAMARAPDAGADLRLFLAPGMAHCRGGSGPDRIDWLGAMESWVERGEAPEELPATRAGSALAWNVCAYPRLPAGQADGSYACR